MSPAPRLLQIHSLIDGANHISLINEAEEFIVFSDHWGPTDMAGHHFNRHIHGAVLWLELPDRGSNNISDHLIALRRIACHTGHNVHDRLPCGSDASPWRECKTFHSSFDTGKIPMRRHLGSTRIDFNIRAMS